MGPNANDCDVNMIGILNRGGTNENGYMTGRESRIDNNHEQRHDPSAAKDLLGVHCESTPTYTLHFLISVFASSLRSSLSLTSSRGLSLEGIETGLAKVELLDLRSMRSEQADAGSRQSFAGVGSCDFVLKVYRNIHCNGVLVHWAELVGRGPYGNEFQSGLVTNKIFYCVTPSCDRVTVPLAD